MRGGVWGLDNIVEFSRGCGFELSKNLELLTSGRSWVLTKKTPAPSLSLSFKIRAISGPYLLLRALISPDPKRYNSSESHGLGFPDLELVPRLQLSDWIALN